MSKLETKCNTGIVYYYSATVVIALLLLSETRGQSDDLNDEINLELLHLYEEALVNNNLSLYRLRKLYFNPSPYTYMYSSSFCLQVFITVNNISGPRATSENCNAAFDPSHSFRSFCLLQPPHDSSDASKLNTLLSFSLSTDMFYLFDPTFYSIMQALAATTYEYTYPDQHDININIDGELDFMPCWENAVYALRMLLVWVSTCKFKCQTHACMYVCIRAIP